MPLYELTYLIQGCDYVERTSWDQTRMLLAPHIKGNIKNHFPLPWDDDKDKFYEEEKPTQDVMDKLAESAKKFEQFIGK